MFNENPKYRKILSFQTCFYVVAIKTIPLHVTSGRAIWRMKLYKKGYASYEPFVSVKHCKNMRSWQIIWWCWFTLLWSIKRGGSTAFIHLMGEFTIMPFTDYHHERGASLKRYFFKASTQIGNISIFVWGVHYNTRFSAILWGINYRAFSSPYIWKDEDSYQRYLIKKTPLDSFLLLTTYVIHFHRC